MRVSIRPPRVSWAAALAVILSPGACAADIPLDQVLSRLERLERENQSLREEVRALRTRVDSLGPTAQAATEAVPPSVGERLDIHERRIEEHAQTKIEASQKLPIQVTGMALMNTFYSTRRSNNIDIPIVAAPVAGRSNAGATFRQSVIGLNYASSAAVLGGRVRGSMTADFFDGLTDTGLPLRMRTAHLEIAWKNTGVVVGLEKPIFNPREPNSLATVGISPLTGAGNLWRWQPQAKLEQRVPFGPLEFRGQIGVLQTNEESGVPAPVPSGLQRRRPGLEGRFELAARLDDERRVEFAPGFHVSTTHVGGLQIPSHLFSLDWFANPWWSKLELTGAFFNGQNIGHFGGLRQGFRLLPDGSAIPVHSVGGWGQLTWLATRRLTFNVFSGMQDDRDSDLVQGNIGRNLQAAANAMFRLAPNVVLSFEALQIRTTPVGGATRHNNRYDLAIAYLF